MGFNQNPFHLLPGVGASISFHLNSLPLFSIQTPSSLFHPGHHGPRRGHAANLPCTAVQQRSRTGIDRYPCREYVVDQQNRPPLERLPRLSTFFQTEGAVDVGEPLLPGQLGLAPGITGTRQHVVPNRDSVYFSQRSGEYTALVVPPLPFSYRMKRDRNHEVDALQESGGPGVRGHASREVAAQGGKMRVFEFAYHRVDGKGEGKSGSRSRERIVPIPAEAAPRNCTGGRRNMISSPLIVVRREFDACSGRHLLGSFEGRESPTAGAAGWRALSDRMEAGFAQTERERSTRSTAGQTDRGIENVQQECQTACQMMFQK